MYIVLADQNIFKIELTQLKFHTGTHGWACELHDHVINVLMTEELVISNTICRSGEEFRSNGSLPTQSFKKSYLTCPKLNCHCGFDIGIPKGRERNDIEELRRRVSILSDEQMELLPEFSEEQGRIRAFGLKQFLKYEMVHVDWFLGRRCNLDCSYCSPSIHDKTSTFPDMDQLKRTYDIVTDLVTNKLSQDFQKKIDYTFHGGEPTLIPGYIPFLHSIAGDSRFKSEILTLTNLTQSAAYYLDLNQVSDIIYSVHLRYLNTAFLKRVEKVLISRGKSSKKFMVKVMYEKAYAQKIAPLMEMIRSYEDVYFSVNPLHDKRSKLLNRYDEEDRKFFSMYGYTSASL